MAQVYRHKRKGFQINYRVYFPDGVAVQKYKYAKNKEAAYSLQRDLDRFEALACKVSLTPEDITYCLHKKYITQDDTKRLMPGNNGNFCPVTWDNLRDVYRQHVKTVCSKSCQTSYIIKIDRVIQYFEDRRQPHELTQNDIKGYITHRRNSVCKATVNKEITALRTVLDHLKDTGVINENPARQVKRFTDTPMRMPRCFTKDELDNIINGLDRYQAYCRGYLKELILSYLYTGFRRHELLNLQTRNVDMNRRTIRIIGKGDRERIIEIHPFLSDNVFKSVIEKNINKRGLFFFGGLDRPLITEESLSRAFRLFLKQIGVYNGDVSLHTLRHTFITYLVHSGAPLMEVKRLAGHSSLKTTLRYTHLVPSDNPVISQIDYGIKVQRKYKS